MPISTGRPIRFFLASQVVMIPSWGDRIFIDSICSFEDLDPLLGALGRDLRLGHLGLNLDLLLLVLAAPQFLQSACPRDTDLSSRPSAVGHQALQLFLQLIALELGERCLPS